ncbi:MAG: hypothetical protein CV089_08530 [Nitrospira sp. WS110]|nr:hypothetical protein [Nitrospira sp. WS110]
MRRVAIIQREIPHYRIRFFEELYTQGKTEGFELMVYTAAPPAEAAAAPAFPYRALPVRYFGKKKSGAYWMRGLEAAVAGTDVIVAPQELQCLTVPYLWARRKGLCTSWIWWGHGYNFQAPLRSSIATVTKEAIKRFMTRRADGVITYTAKGAEYWRQQGLPEERVIPYYNTIDVEGLRKIRSEISEQQLSDVRKKLGLEGKRVLLFSGRLYAEKKVDFLLKAFAILKKTLPDVALLIIGDGAERLKLEKLAKQLDLGDVHFLGELVDPRETATYFSLADLMVIPGLVGLAIVHGFAFGLPLVTTRHDFHSPEIEYLSADNGIMTTHDERELSNAINSILADRHRHMEMRKDANHAAMELLLGLSAKRFTRAIDSFTNCS